MPWAAVSFGAAETAIFRSRLITRIIYIYMPSFSDSIVLFVLALLLFGPKKLPVLARELGKWVGEFRRASNEFKMQMEEELRLVEQADRQKKIEAMEAAAPVAPPIVEPEPARREGAEAEAAEVEASPEAAAVTPLPIATSGELNIMPPSTGLPTARSTERKDDALGGLLESIPEAEPDERPMSPIEVHARENALHGD